MVWTYSGFFLEKQQEKTFVYASDEKELKMLADEQGNLDKYFEEQMKDIKELGVYQVLFGYGGMQDPIIYFVKKIAGELNWQPKVNK